MTTTWFSLSKQSPLLVAGLCLLFAACASSEPVNEDPPPVAQETPEEPSRPQPYTPPRQAEPIQIPAAYRACEATYNAGDYAAAATCFSEVANNESNSKEVRKAALEYWSRSAFALNEMEEAREAIEALLALQPPLVELDPDVEPPSLINLYYDVRNEIVVPKEDPGMKTLAVMDFRNYATRDHDQWEPMQWGFSSMMIEQLQGATDLKLVDRENLQWIMQELDLQQEPGRVDQETAVRMGRLMGAHAMVFGGIYTQGRGGMRLSARVVKVETGEILLGESVEGDVDDFYELLGDLSKEMAELIGSTISREQIGASTETTSLDAAQAYSQGLALLEKNDYSGAQEMFLAALEIDPSYERARQRADGLNLEMVAEARRGDRE